MNTRNQLDIVAEFRRRRRRHCWLFPLFLAWLGAMAFGGMSRASPWDSPSVAVQVLGGAALVYVFVFPVFGVGVHVATWRCPSCEQFLGRTRNPRFCPRCGVPLQ